MKANGGFPNKPEVLKAKDYQQIQLITSHSFHQNLN